MTPRRTVRRLGAVLVLAALVSATAAAALADEVTITPVYNSKSTAIGRSYLRLFNPSSDSGTTATVRIMAADGTQLASLPLSMPSLVSRQLEMAQLEAMAGLSPATAAAYALKISTAEDIGAYAQHVIYNDTASTFTNASACDTGRARTRYLINVHTSVVKNLGYPSVLAVQNDGVIAAQPYMVFVDAEGGEVLKYYEMESLGAQEMRTYDVVDLMTTAGVTLGSQNHVNIILTRFNEYVGFPAHLVDNAISGLFANMTEMCAVPAANPTILPAPPESLGLGDYYRQYVDADGIPVVGTGRARAAGMQDVAAIVTHMMTGKTGLREELIANGGRISIAARDEEMSEAPGESSRRREKVTQEQSDGSVLNRQGEGIRGYASYDARFGEEPWLGELALYLQAETRYSIVVHEFAHMVHYALETLDTDIYADIKSAYDVSMATGRWNGTYSSVNEFEYFAVGAELWFQTGESDHGDGFFTTRAELETYDPELHAVLARVFPSAMIPGIPRFSAAQGGFAKPQAVDPRLPPPEVRRRVRGQ